MVAGALVALAAWPVLQTAASAGRPPGAASVAPLRDDTLIRAKTIAFEEARLARDPEDQLTPRMLAAQYLQRYREKLDPGDVVRAEAAARRSLRAQPVGNVAALQELAAAQLTFHRFTRRADQLARGARASARGPVAARRRRVGSHGAGRLRRRTASAGNGAAGR